MTLRIFLSHSSKDNQFSSRLAKDLRRVLGDETAVWYDGSLSGGNSWWRKIVQEISRCNIFLVVLSPDAMASAWVNDEIDLAWREKNSSKHMIIIPLLYQPCEVRNDLQNLQIISFLSQTYDEAFNELLLSLRSVEEAANKKTASDTASIIPPALPNRGRKLDPKVIWGVLSVSLVILVIVAFAFTRKPTPPFTQSGAINLSPDSANYAYTINSWSKPAYNIYCQLATCDPTSQRLTLWHEGNQVTAVCWTYGQRVITGTPSNPGYDDNRWVRLTDGSYLPNTWFVRRNLSPQLPKC